MKIVMYHYIRDLPRSEGTFNFLSPDNFSKQLDYFEKSGGFVSKEEFFNYLDEESVDYDLNNKFLLTFDDGFSDHYKIVLPELKKRGLWGLFYIPTDILSRYSLLNVHAVHYLIGTFDIHLLYEVTQSFLAESSFSLSSQSFYDTQDSSFKVKSIKSLLIISFHRVTRVILSLIYFVSSKSTPGSCSILVYVIR